MQQADGKQEQAGTSRPGNDVSNRRQTDRRSGVDTRSEEEKRLQGERRSGKDRRNPRPE